MEARVPVRGRTLGAVALALASALACSRGDPPPVPGEALRARLEAHLARERAQLAGSPAHLGLVFPVDPAQLARALAPVRAYADGDAFVLGSSSHPEPHGGGVLALLLDHWRPDARAATLDDRIPFSSRRNGPSLRQLYEGHRRQLFLPPAEDGTTRLPRMRFRFPPTGERVDTDAYKMLGVLIDTERDPERRWRNHAGQALSLERLMRAVREWFLRGSHVGRAEEDHTNLHLVELLLAHHARWPERSDPEAIQRRFLAVELGERVEPGLERSEVLGHVAESVGRLVATPGIDWTSDEQERVRDWLDALERRHFRQLDGLPLQHLCHLLKGLRLVAAHREVLE